MKRKWTELDKNEFQFHYLAEWDTTEFLGWDEIWVCIEQLYITRIKRLRANNERQKKTKNETKEIIAKLLNKGYAVTLYEDALGNITAKAESTASESVLSPLPEDNLGILKDSEWGKSRIGQTIKLVSVTITEGKTIEEALRRLEQKTLH